MEICEKIKKERKNKGMTQMQLGELCGMADSAIRKYESGILIPKLETICKFSRALKVNPMQLLPDWFIDEVMLYETP